MVASLMGEGLMVDCKRVCMIQAFPGNSPVLRIAVKRYHGLAPVEQLRQYGSAVPQGETMRITPRSPRRFFTASVADEKKHHKGKMGKLFALSFRYDHITVVLDGIWQQFDQNTENVLEKIPSLIFYEPGLRTEHESCG
jgi:hypothetical protein